MPIDMSAPNSIIQSYFQGVRLRQDDEARAQQNEQFQQQLEQAQREFETNLKYKQEDLKLRQAAAKLKADYDAAQYRRQMVADVQSGTLRPDSILTPNREEGIASLPLAQSPIYPQSPRSIKATIEDAARKYFSGSIAEVAVPKFAQIEGLPDTIQTDPYEVALQRRLDEASVAGNLDAKISGKKAEEVIKAQHPYLMEREEAKTQSALNKLYVQHGLRLELEGRKEAFKRELETNRASLRRELTKTVGESAAADRRVDRLLSMHDANPITKQYAAVRGQIGLLKTFPEDGELTPAQNIALLYLFAKINDPESVVREGEYKTVQNYSQTLKERFGVAMERVTRHAAFLSPTSVKLIKQAIIEKASSLEKEYFSYRDNMETRINKIRSGDPLTSEELSNYKPISSLEVQNDRTGEKFLIPDTPEARAKYGIK